MWARLTRPEWAHAWASGGIRSGGSSVAKALELPEQKVILHGISWETYERLLADHGDRPVPRFAYDRGVLEAMSPSVEHEGLARTIAMIVSIVAEEVEVDVFDAGSTTDRKSVV